MSEYVRTEVRGVYDETGFAVYLAKYISKKETDPSLKVNCKIWGCSHALSNINVTLGEDLTPDFNGVMFKFTSEDTVVRKEMEHCTVYHTSLTNKKKVPQEILNTIAEIRDNIGKKKEKVQAVPASGVVESPQPAPKPLIRWTQSTLFPS